MEGRKLKKWSMRFRLSWSHGNLRGGGPAVGRVRPPFQGRVDRMGGWSLGSGPAGHADQRASGVVSLSWKSLAVLRVSVSWGRAYAHQASSVSAAVRWRMSAQMVSASR